MTEIPADWKQLIDAANSLADAPDATDAVTIEMMPPNLPYETVLSRHQAWRNKYDRATARGLIPQPFRIRRFKRSDGGYTIEAVADLTHVIEGAMIVWPGEEEPA